MNVSQLFVKALENENVEYVFGVPGEENEDLLFALADSKIEFVPVRHEQGGAFMANMWGRLTGNAGVCLSTLGPGATNLLTGVADAYLDHAPMVAITAQGGVNRLHHESHQVIDIKKIMEPITKWNGVIYDAHSISEIVKKAFFVATDDKPGPTHIELPEDIAHKEIKQVVLPITASKILKPSISEEHLVTLKTKITLSKRPLILAGNGVIRGGASAALRKFAEQCNIPVTTTFMAKGVVSDKADYSLGAVGLGFKDYVLEAFESADLVICIGYDIVEYEPHGWNKNADKYIIHIDTTTASVHKEYAPSLQVIADLHHALESLTDAMKGISFESYYIDIRDRLRKSKAAFKLQEGSDTFNVPGVLAEIREAMPADGIVISDVGSHKMWIARNYPTYEPNTCIISNGLASMGISLPGAISADLLFPDRPVLAIMGDGGAMMNIQELATARKLNSSCIFLIFNDSDYGLISWKQERSKGSSVGTALVNPNFVKLAESFGINAYKPDTIDDLRETLRETISNNELAVIEVPIATSVNQQLIKELKDYFA